MPLPAPGRRGEAGEAADWVVPAAVGFSAEGAEAEELAIQAAVAQEGM